MAEQGNIIETNFSLRLARVESKVSETGHMLTVRVMRSKKELFRIKAELNELFNIDKILNTLELAIGTRKLHRIQSSKNDLIFRQFMDVQTFKEYYSSYPRNFKIYLFEPVKIVKESEEKRKVMLWAHVHGSEHYEYKKTVATLRSFYYWKRVSKDIGKFIKEFSHCSAQLNMFEENIGVLGNQF